MARRRNGCRDARVKAALNRPWLPLAAALLAAGVLVRIALYFPLAMFQIDSDAVIAGLCAFRVMVGHYPAFLPGGTRIGAASCYSTAAYFHLFGVGRPSLAFTGLTWGVLYLLFMLLFLWSVLGARRACLAFLFAVVPSEQFMTVTYAPWGYGEIMASCAATLWTASLWRRQAKALTRFWFGVSVGIGLWCSVQTLMIVIPAVLWIAKARRQTVIGESGPAFAGALIGLTPYLIGNLGHGFPSLNANWAAEPVTNVAQAWSNFAWLWSYLIPHLLFGGFGWGAQSLALIAAYGVVTVGFLAALAQRRRAPGDGAMDATTLLALVVLVSSLLFSFSAAGTIRGWTVRYIAPLYVVMPIFLGTGIEFLWRRRRWLAIATTMALLVPSLCLYGLPGTALRAELTRDLHNDEMLRERLARDRVGLVYGAYVWVYHLNFDTRERVAGVPYHSAYDYYDYGDQLGSVPVRWALLGGREEVSCWAHAAHASGALARDGALWVFVAGKPAPNAARLLATLRAVEN